MLYTEFPASELRGSEEEDFHFFKVFLCLNTEPHAAGQFLIRRPLFE